MDYDRTRYAVWKLPHPVLLHWVLNPGLAINELLLGQRIPAVTLIDRTASGPLLERTRVPCRACGGLHDGRLWGGKNAFGHHFGLICPDCGARIATLYNVLTLLALALTFPFWMPVRRAFASRALEAQRARLETMRRNPDGLISKREVDGVRMGLNFGLAMGVFLFVFNIADRVGIWGWPPHPEAWLESAGLALAGAIVAGVFFGVAMSVALNWPGRGAKGRRTGRH